MWNKADREEKHPHLNSQECLNSRCFFCLPGLQPGCALYPRNLFCTICISPKYSFHLPVCSGVIPAWHSPPGPCCRTEALREVRQAALLLHHCFSFPLHSLFSTVQGCQTPSEAPNIIQEPEQGPSYALRVSGRLQPPAHTCHGCVLFLREFSHRDTQSSRPSSSSPAQGPCSSPPLPHLGTITQFLDPSSEAPVGVTQSTGSLSSLLVYLHLIQEPQFASISSSMPGSRSLIHS